MAQTALPIFLHWMALYQFGPDDDHAGLTHLFLYVLATHRDSIRQTIRGLFRLTAEMESADRKNIVGHVHRIRHSHLQCRRRLGQERGPSLKERCPQHHHVVG